MLAWDETLILGSISCFLLFTCIAQSQALQANREARVLSARGEKPKEAFSPRVHLTEEVMNKKLRYPDWIATDLRLSCLLVVLP